MIYEKPEHQMLKIANKLYKMRIDLGMEIKEMSELTTIPLKELDAIEHGYPPIMVADLIKILAVHRSNLHDFFSDIDS